MGRVVDPGDRKREYYFLEGMTFPAETVIGNIVEVVKIGKVVVKKSKSEKYVYRILAMNTRRSPEIDSFRTKNVD